MEFVGVIVSIGLIPAVLGPSKIKPFDTWCLYGAVLSLAVFLALYFSGAA